MITIKNIFPECDADTLLVRLILQKGIPGHRKGVSKVSMALEKEKDSLGVFIGLIDFDKRKYQTQNKYLRNFSQVVFDRKDENEGLVITKIPNKQHFLIFVYKEFEPWIWKQAALANVNSAEFGIKDLEVLYKLSKSYGESEDINFKKFVNAVVMADPPGIKLLRAYLTKDFLYQSRC